MARFRRAVIALASALAIATMGAFVLASPASAYTQNFCGNVGQGGTCYGSGLHSFYYIQVGSSGSNLICTYMWNANNGVVRGNVIGCDWGAANLTFNRTSDLWYNARGYHNMAFTVNMPGVAFA